MTGQVIEGGISSGVIGFDISRDDIILMALEDIKVFAPDFQSPPPAAIARAAVRLNMMIRSWQATGIGLWLNQLYTITPLVVGQTSYLLGPHGTPPLAAAPLNVVEARRVDSSGNELNMMPLSRDEYMTLSIKNSPGTPTQWYLDRQLEDCVFYIWETASDITDVITMTIRMPIQAFVNSTDAPYFPLEWADALHFNLAMRLISVYDVPQRVAANVVELAKLSLDNANDFDREQVVSVQFIPDPEW